MLVEPHINSVRENELIALKSDIIITGGGLAGTCAAITAARNGAKVILVQDRPVLGGNSSSEVRLWILGATSHMGNNNRWAREGGVIDEILVENLYRNKEGNPIIFDTILLEKVKLEKNITLLLNTIVHGLEKENDTKIKSVNAYCSQTSTGYHLSAPMFIDASGDGILGFLSGAPFRMGAETKDEFGELFAPNEDYGKMLGHTLYFYSKDTGQPVKYVAPEFALRDIKQIPRYKAIDSSMEGCQFWWFEYGGRFADTIKATEDIKWELWRIVYGVWDYIKNSGEFPEAENLTLEWVGLIPGKRESRRFEGDYMLKQHDIIEQKHFDDAVAFGGWAIDLHPGDGVYSKLPGCNQWHSKGIYEIPYRCFISKSIQNLFLAGRIISASHVAFGSTRVMATSAHGAQAVGLAAAMCAKYGITNKKVLDQEYLLELQNQLNFQGQSIPKQKIDYSFLDLTKPSFSSSSTLNLNGLLFNGDWSDLSQGFSQLIPLRANTKYAFKILVEASKSSRLTIQLRKSSKPGNYTPDHIIELIELPVSEGQQYLKTSFNLTLDQDQYAFLTILPHKDVKVMTSNQRITGILSLFQKQNKAVSNNGKQKPPKNIGIDSFEFWTPKRRPGGKNLAFECEPSLDLFCNDNLGSGLTRPVLGTNAWAAAYDDANPELTLSWESPQRVSQLRLFFDTDYDHPMESVQIGHPEDIIPFCVQNYSIISKNGEVLFEKKGNYQTINDVVFEKSIITDELRIRLEHPSIDVPAALFEVLCF